MSSKNICTSAILVFTFFAFTWTPKALAARNAADDVGKYFSETAPPYFGQPKAVPVVDWAEPPLGCVEEMVPHAAPDHTCLDLTQVADPLKDWPPNLTVPDKDFWFSHRRNLTFCRATELLRRETAHPGSQTEGAIEISWMLTEAIKNYSEKVAAVYEAANTYGVPALVLTGAVYQESLFAELGLSDDGGNFSCGVEQINLIGWCTWANSQPAADKAVMGWPSARVSCSDSSLVNLNYIRPFYKIALTRLNGLPEYRLQKSHFQNIPQLAVENEWPAASPQVQKLRYKLIQSFINNCTDPKRGILAKANELRSLYNENLSPAFQNRERYTGSERFHRQCLEVAKDNAYPLHSGWLLAVASYNAGPRAIDAVAHYNQWTRSAFDDAQALTNFTPEQIVSSIYWAGKYNASTDKIDFSSIDGLPRSWIWYAGCVAQRHIARVMQHVTLLPEFFVDSLEGQFPCEKSTFDKDGKLIQTSVPPARKTSTGVH